MSKIDRFVRRLAHDYVFGATFFGVLTFAINLIYAASQGLLAAYYGSLWYTVLAVYYGVLCLLRGFTLFLERLAARRRGLEKLTRTLKYYRIIGVMLVILNAVFAVMVWYMIGTGTASRYTIISAVYTGGYAVYKLVAAIVRSVRAKRYDNYVIRALRKITLTDAVVSTFVLVAALVQSFGGGILGTLFPLVLASGIAACGTCLVFTVYMVISSSVKLKKLSVIESEDAGPEFTSADSAKY